MDLTDDVSEYDPIPVQAPRLPMANITPKGLNQRNIGPRQRRHEQDVTSRTLHKIVKQLRHHEGLIDVHRDSLRKRWEADASLQLQTVTDHLRDLNDIFRSVEVGIRDAVVIINEHLL